MMRTPVTLLRLTASTSGAALVEFALVMPLFLILLVTVFDIGFAAYSSMQVHTAAEAGAQYATRNTWDPDAITAVVTTATGTAGIAANPAPVTLCGCPDGGVFTPTVCANSCPSGK